MSSLRSGNRLSGSSRQKLVRKIIDQVFRHSQSPRKADLRVVAQQIVQLYPKTFEDKIGDVVVGSGEETLLMQLTSRRDNLNRSPDVTQFKRSLTGQDRPPKKKPSDSYGCINWQPQVPEDLAEATTCRQEMTEACSKPPSQWNLARLKHAMQVTFPLQRQGINGGSTITNLKQTWPFLFVREGIAWHYEQLMGRNCHETLLESLQDKAGKLLRYLFTVEAVKNHPLASLAEEITEDQDQDQRSILPGVMVALLRQFEEPIESVFILVEVGYFFLSKFILSLSLFNSTWNK